MQVAAEPSQEEVEEVQVLAAEPIPAAFLDDTAELTVSVMGSVGVAGVRTTAGTRFGCRRAAGEDLGDQRSEQLSVGDLEDFRRHMAPVAAPGTAAPCVEAGEKGEQRCEAWLGKGVGDQSGVAVTGK
ncbi:hypothetical protein [Streptomyces palmae]|uniref:hypothetical protein n=1 Tax=Streptomyces palmae TaxID=1701085 RepID=UPI001FD7B2A8|nr:hypothetical protein [Streptomyces palmae]